jgi:hypothetical protein
MKVVIVGHGPSLLAGKLGKEIDAHDVVVRLKRCQETLIYPETYGAKTDYLAGSFNIASQLPQVTTPSKGFWVFLDSRHGDVTDDQILNLRRYMERTAPTVIDKGLCERWQEIYREMREPSTCDKRQVRGNYSDTDLGHNHMSQGAMAIIHAAALLNPESITLAGFDNIVTGGFTWSVTRGPDWDKYPDHNWETENRLVERVMEEYCVPINILMPEEKE